MQILASLATDAIQGTASEPAVGGSTVVNGKYMLTTPPGVAVEVDDTSYLTPQNAGSIPGLIADDFLARNPMYDHRIAQFFLESTDIALLDLTIVANSPNAGNVAAGTAPVLAAGPLGPRCQIGRGAGPAPVGVAPNSVAILPANRNHPVADTYGSIVLNTVDLTPFNPGTPGTDEVMVWWKVAEFTTTDDVIHGYNVTANTNTPSLRNFDEVAQAVPAGMKCYATVDDGVSWFEVLYMTPTDLVASGTNFRLAFINEGSTKHYLVGYIVLFPDLP